MPAAAEYLSLRVAVDPARADLLLAELAALGFEGFQESTLELTAYVPTTAADRPSTEALLARYGATAFAWEVVPSQNWNAQWETNFEPLVVADQVYVRANFHPPRPAYPYQIAIAPRMAFGTGHHATTYLMMAAQLGLPHTDRTVLDVGCGTGILSVLAEKLGARRVVAFDYDTQAVANTAEHVSLNGCQRVEWFEGDATRLPPQTRYDIVLANISRNVLLELMPTFPAWLIPGGSVLLSGFYERDAPAVERAAAAVGLRPVAHTARESWSCCQLSY